jgi:hypothetical protein
MIDALSTTPLRSSSSVPRYPVSRLFLSAAELLLHPVSTLPIVIYLLGGTSGQIVWYAIVAGIAAGLTGPSGALVNRLPETSRFVIVVLLVVQALGFLLTGIVAIGVDTFSNEALLRLAAVGYLLLTVPTRMLSRIAEQGHEFRRSAAASVSGILPAVTGTLIAGLIVWRLFDSGGMGPDDLLARVVLTGALLATAAAWLASYPTILALQLPHPARPMPTVRSPHVLSNEPLRRYLMFQGINGLARFADPFLLVGVLTIISPGIVWLGGAVLAFAAGDAIARVLAVNAWDGFNVRVLFTIGGFLHAVAFLVIAFAADVFQASVVADREPSHAWQNWAVIIAAAALGASYLLGRTGHLAYVRSISSPHTRDLSLTSVGIVSIVTAFAPLIAVRLLDAQDMATLLQIGAGASIISLLATALVVPTYATPRRPRGAWGLRR